MKKIIDGLLYDTKKAELLCKWNSDYDYLKCTLWHNYLYRTKAGRYFLFKAGIELGFTKETIKPLTDEEAFKILVERDPGKAREFFPNKIKEA